MYPRARPRRTPSLFGWLLNRYRPLAGTDYPVRLAGRSPGLRLLRTDPGRARAAAGAEHSVTDRGRRRHRGPARVIDLLLRLPGRSGLAGGRSRSDVTGLRRAAAARGYRWPCDHTRRPATWYPAASAASAEMIARGS